MKSAAHSSGASAGVTVRLATVDDSPALARLSGQLGYPSSPEQLSLRLAEILARPDHAVLVAELPGTGAGAQVVGWVHASVRRILESDPFVEIGGLVVDENHRGLGIGALVLDQLERWARSTGCTEITVRSNVLRERAHAFYERLGFAPVKTQRVLRKAI